VKPSSNMGERDVLNPLTMKGQRWNIPLSRGERYVFNCTVHMYVIFGRSQNVNRYFSLRKGLKGTNFYDQV
jgi:hypothetical protein